ncbi:oxidoreductase [Apiospora phragmitis]|uniref:Oxidoreductase n=1 Tax=Apiospora phragmitis TaxID=2905665 RepID=A0ABR1T460_9PEZI
MAFVATEELTLPTLDVSKWLKGGESERQKFASEIFNVLKRHGFTKIINHGMSDDTLKEIYHWVSIPPNAMRHFSNQEQLKAKIANAPSSTKPQRGWSRRGLERIAKLNWGRTEKGDAPALDLQDAKEHVDLGSPEDKEYHNQWPREEDLPGYRVSMEKQYDALHKLSEELLSALELALGLSRGSLTSVIHTQASEQRITHYPAIKVVDMQRGDTSRIWPHSDLGVLTCLVQDEVGGLEVEDREHKGSFFPVRRERWDEMVINVGETLERLTNGALPAGIHQVTVPRELQDQPDATVPPRYSCAFFVKIDRTADVGVLPRFLENGEKRRYKSMTALEFHLHRLTTAY